MIDDSQEINNEPNLIIKKYFLKISNNSNLKCTQKCQIDKFEDYILLQQKSPEIFEKDYKEQLLCYDICVQKNLNSGLLAISTLQKFFNETKHFTA